MELPTEEVWSESEALESCRDGVPLLVEVAVFPSELLNSDAINAARTLGVRESQSCEIDLGTTVSDVALLRRI